MIIPEAVSELSKCGERFWNGNLVRFSSNYSERVDAGAQEHWPRTQRQARSNVVTFVQKIECFGKYMPYLRALVVP